HPEDTGAIAVPDRAGVPKVEAGQVLRDIGDDDTRPATVVIEEAHADDVVLGVTLRQRSQHRMRPVEIERHRAWRRVDVAARPLGDPEQQKRLAVQLSGSGVEDRDHLELRERRFDVPCRDERVLGEALTEAGRATDWDGRHAVCTGLSVSIASTGELTGCASRTSRVSARTRRPTFGHAISLP